MPANLYLKCPDCHMTFNSHSLLQKHRSKFCVGALTNPEMYSARAQSEPRYEEDYNAKVEELQELKKRRQRQREESLEDKGGVSFASPVGAHIISPVRLMSPVHELPNNHLMPFGEPPQPIKTPEMELWEAKSTELRQVLSQGSNKMPKPRPTGDRGPMRATASSPASVATMSSMSIRLPSSPEASTAHLPDYTPRASEDRSNRQQQLRMAAESHGRNLAEYQSRSHQLERQKQEIDRRLQTLNDGDGYVMNQLQLQEERNQRTLRELKNSVKGMKGGRPTSPNTLLAQIHAMRQAYLRQGGSNPVMLQQIAEMEQEAMRMGNKAPREHKKHKSKAHYDSLMEQILAFELENNRLQKELLLIQERNNEHMLLKRTAEEAAAREKEMAARQAEYLQKLKDLEHEMELARQQAKMEQLRRDMDHQRPRQPQAPQPCPMMRPHYIESTKVVPQPVVVRTEVPQPIIVSKPIFVRAEAPQPVIVPQLMPVEVAEMPAMMQPPPQMPMNMADADPLMPAPYDQHAGFMVFYDYISGLDMGVHACRLVVGLYNRTAQYGEPSVLPTVYTESQGAGYHQQGRTQATIGAKQPVPRCPAQSDLGLVMELQTAVGGMPYGNPGALGMPQMNPNASRLVTSAWTKIDLFDAQGRLISGRWRVPLRLPPMRPNIPGGEINSHPQYGQAQLFIRLVNLRDAHVQVMGTVGPQAEHLYQHPPQIIASPPAPSITPPATESLTPPVTESVTMLPPLKLLDHDAEVIVKHGSFHPQAQTFQPPLATYTPPPPSTIPPMTADSYRSERQPLVQPASPAKHYEYDEEVKTVGFQVDRVKHAEPGEGKVRLTAYHKTNAQVVQSATSPVTCSTTAVKSNFKYKYHVYGQQEATFEDVDIKPDMVLILRFYLRKKVEKGVDDLAQDDPVQSNMYDDETLVAWGVLPLMSPRKIGLNGTTVDTSILRVNTGSHVVRLYTPPVPDVDQIPLEAQWHVKDWKRYNTKASARIHVFTGQPRPGSLSPSEASSDDDEACPEFAWLPHERKKPPTEPFKATDGFDLYIDGCRHLPDCVSITRVAGRILDRKYEKLGKDINSTVRLESDIYNAVYEYRVEYREPNMPPSATLLLKIYTIDKFYKQLTVAGYATLNVFVETGTEKQPLVDSGGVQISLNEGAHQLRLYHQGPNGVDPLTEGCLREAGIRHIPCASLLVRLVKAPLGPSGRSLEADKVPQADWGRMGLWHPRPSYSDRVYLSMRCVPTAGDCKLLHTQVKRSKITMRDALYMIASPREVKMLKTDKAMETFIRNQLTRLMDKTPMDLDMTFIAQYNPRHGIKVAIDGAMNLPWSNFTHVMFCLNPPGAFYMGQPQGSYDKIKFTENLDLTSSNKSPAWRDGFKHFNNRSYHRFLTLVVHLQEISCITTADSYKYALLEQAWTAVQVFSEGYACTSVYQLPLLQGSPTSHMMKQIAREPFKVWMDRNLSSGTVKYADHSSVFVRMCDARRDDELPADVPEGRAVQLNTDYIPKDSIGVFAQENPGRDMISIVPQGKTPEQFINNLSTKFKSLVYKLYEEGST